jgi:Pyruvate/2-oxoacid:ferredoxin oxidoreductase gamma subunit
MCGDFLNAARLIGGAADRAGLSAQVRTSMWPAPPGGVDRAIIRIAPESLRDLSVPRKYDLEVICEPSLAVIPPMGGALLLGGVLLVNAPVPPKTPPDGPPVFSADLGALAARLGAPLAFALAGSAWAAMAALTPEMAFPLGAIESAAPDAGGTPSAGGTPLGEAEIKLLRAGFEQGAALLAGFAPDGDRAR